MALKQETGKLMTHLVAEALEAYLYKQEHDHA
jgi:hypothetical protein